MKGINMNWKAIATFEHVNDQHIETLMNSILHELNTTNPSQGHINEKFDEAKRHFNLVYDNYKRRKGIEVSE